MSGVGARGSCGSLWVMSENEPGTCQIAVAKLPTDSTIRNASNVLKCYSIRTLRLREKPSNVAAATQEAASTAVKKNHTSGKASGIIEVGHAARSPAIPTKIASRS